MSEHAAEQTADTSRLPTHIPGLDTILNGGLLRGGVYMVTGLPGAGKTIFVNHVAFNHAATGERVVYFSVFGETHSRLINHIRQFSFFSPERVGTAISYYSAYSAVRDGGLPGLEQLVERIVRERQASLIILDALPLDFVAPGEHNVWEMYDFIHNLQAAAELTNCTVLLAVPTYEGLWTSLSLLFVDGALELSRMTQQAVVLRSLEIRKFRGSTYRAASQPFRITSDGISLFP